LAAPLTLFLYLPATFSVFNYLFVLFLYCALPPCCVEVDPSGLDRSAPWWNISLNIGTSAWVARRWRA
jgi:hypothetical protein